jgi:hypothetical protein
MTTPTLEEALTMLTEAYEWIQGIDHDLSCPRNRDDYACKCGLSDLKDRMAEMLDIPR